MGFRIIRQTSDTPNVNNIDDIVPMRYAYGNQNGYIIDIGTELKATYENGTFTVQSGRVVIEGAEIHIDANGLSTRLDTGLETRYFEIYFKFNLDSEVAELESYYSTTSYDDILKPQSKSVISGETAYLLLYRLKLDGAVQTEIEKVVRQIDYNHRRLLWTGNAEIGTTNPQGSLNSFATIPVKENTMYEIQGEITHGSQGYTKETFVIYLQVGADNGYGYKAEKIVGTWITNELLQFKKVEIYRNGNFFSGRALLPTIYFSGHNLVYNSITASVTKIYEVE